MEEIRCVECDKRKIRILLSQKGKAYVYVDKTGNRWNGRQCPQCRETYNRRRNHKYYSQVIRPIRLKGQKTEFEGKRCRKCHKPLPANRYFNCEECIPVLETADPYIYVA